MGSKHSPRDLPLRLSPTSRFFIDGSRFGEMIKLHWSSRKDRSYRSDCFDLRRDTAEAGPEPTTCIERPVEGDDH